MVRASSLQKFTERKRFTRPHCCWPECTFRSQNFTERIRFASHCCWIVHMSRTLKFTERIRFASHLLDVRSTYISPTKVWFSKLLLNDTYVTNTQVYWRIRFCPTLLIYVLVILFPWYTAHEIHQFHVAMSRNPQFHMRTLYAYTKLPHCNQFHHQWLLASWNQPATCKVKLIRYCSDNIACYTL